MRDKLGVPDNDVLRVDRHVSSPSDFAYVSGSILEGFGNRRSDYDVFVVREQEGSTSPTAEMLELTWIDFEFWNRSRWDSLISTVNSCNTTDVMSLSAIRQPTLIAYYRVLIGEPVWNGPMFEEARRAFSRSRLSEVYARWAGLRAYYQLFLSRMFLEAGASTRAISAGKLVAAWSLEAFLAEAGESYVGSKWRFEKLRRGFGEGSSQFAKAWSLKAPGDRTPEDYLDDVAAYCTAHIRPLGDVTEVGLLLFTPHLVSGVRRAKLDGEDWLLAAHAGVPVEPFADVVLKLEKQDSNSWHRAPSDQVLKLLYLSSIGLVAW